MARLIKRTVNSVHDDVIKWKHFTRYLPFVWGIHRSPVKPPHIGQWPGALMFSLICSWINGWVNNGEAGDLRRHRAHYDVTVMPKVFPARPPAGTVQATKTYFIWIVRYIVWSVTLDGDEISQLPLTHWGREKMDAISQTIFSNAFSWMKMF